MDPNKNDISKIYFVKVLTKKPEISKHAKTNKHIYALIKTEIFTRHAPIFSIFAQKAVFKTKFTFLTLEALGRGEGGQIDPSPSIFFGFKFLLLDRLSKALAQLFLVCEHIF